jgi:hypothetical protein
MDSKKLLPNLNQQIEIQEGDVQQVLNQEQKGHVFALTVENVALKRIIEEQKEFISKCNKKCSTSTDCVCQKEENETVLNGLEDIPKTKDK